MSVFADARYADPLRDATTDLIEEFSSGVPAGKVIGAVGRAKNHVRSGYDVLQFGAPPPDEYVSLIVGLARQELSELVGPVIRRGRALGVG